MRLLFASMLVALAAAVSACGGPRSEASPDFLFDTTRSDVSAFKGPDGAQLGVVNTTYRIVWDYEHGYSRFGADNQVIWGPLASIPESELQSLAGDGLEVSEDALRRGGSGGTVCTCCYWYIDGSGCGCYECRSY